MACDTKPVYLKVFNFNTPGWETLTSSTNCATSTDFTLSSNITADLSYYYSPGQYWVFARVYQDWGNSTLKTDYADISFGAGAASFLSLGNHTAGQETNKFEISENSLSNPELYNFKLTASGGDVSVTSVVIQLYDIRGFVSSDITAPKIYLDADNDGMVDGEETTQVGGTGNVSISGSSGTITFSSSFSVSLGDHNYILRAETVSGIDPGDQISIMLWHQDITSDASGTSGAAAPALHMRQGGTSGGASIGTAGQVYSPISGGTEEGGEEIGGEVPDGGDEGGGTPGGGTELVRFIIISFDF
ncbi:MAG: hypothetical protein A2Y98_00335 [Candidatus Portnoybacteria bacterium RBG_19FT_COMBO_36_7]|uniref:Uncharacterized protein n=1 Tax=Candidatus Portnoybacteria bacterium RBG_19FT_COMBO_36_7 TaxID=1801992 RepID=A0A1G2F955_9BACT|nr:MAG: hypothetical protein A2Y98_00335 [Candidatus Portnoybacteria bacterium RBG_19FT_COMBO_36_7]